MKFEEPVNPQKMKQFEHRNKRKKLSKIQAVIMQNLLKN